MERLGPRLLSWASIIEPEALAQTHRLADMPFIWPHVAIMPDVHHGKGAAVGTVIPTRGAIIPAAVGVDVGCFRGDTRISLIDGTQRSLKDLVKENEPFWVYSLDKNGNITPGKAQAVRTRSDAELMQVTISGGDKIVCTPDHLFMLNDGTYREAKDLRIKDSLMPLYRHSYNHSVIEVTTLYERADVYCLQVGEHHNFALAAGIFVHNCGMMAVKTQWTKPSLLENGKGLRALRAAIEKAVPLSAGNYNGHIQDSARPLAEELERLPGSRAASKIAPNWHLQLGTLGSGNHFIEVTLDEHENVWLFLHSGSRGVGNKLAVSHITVAKNICRKSGARLNGDPDLAYLTQGTEEFDSYIRDLKWAQHFALLNREEMMSRVRYCISESMGEAVSPQEAVNCYHNYTEEMPAELAQRLGLDNDGTIWLSRKGAINASEGTPGLIPGSMGDLSYVVEGKGNDLSLWSSPHGAGRRRSRGAARREFTMDDLEQRMEGIEWRHTDKFLDEHPQAYKPIATVMEDASELVSIRHAFRQILSVKGD